MVHKVRATKKVNLARRWATSGGGNRRRNAIAALPEDSPRRPPSLARVAWLERAEGAR